jgi:ribosome maturation factor RimP
VLIDKVKEQVTRLVEDPLRREGFELAQAVLSRYRSRWTLKLYVYQQGGVSIDDCARASTLVGDLIDGEDLFEEGYTLEVSSPGLDRPLKTAMDFKYRMGETVKIGFADPKRKQVTAIIAGTSGNRVDFEDQNGGFSLDLAEIESARIVF